MINEIIVNTDFFTKLKLSFSLVSALFMVLFGLYAFSHAIFISQHLGLFRFIRWNFLITFILFWPEWVVQVGIAMNAAPEKIVRWKVEVYRIAMWLIILELVFSENLVMRLINLISLK